MGQDKDKKFKKNLLLLKRVQEQKIVVVIRGKLVEPVGELTDKEWLKFAKRQKKCMPLKATRYWSQARCEMVTACQESTEFKIKKPELCDLTKWLKDGKTLYHAREEIWKAWRRTLKEQTKGKVMSCSLCESLIGGTHTLSSPSVGRHLRSFHRCFTGTKEMEKQFMVCVKVFH